MPVSARALLGRAFAQFREEFTPGDTLQVVCFKNSPVEAVDAFLTVGLGRHELTVSEGKKVRQELILPVSGANLSRLIVSFLLFIRRHRATT